MNSKKLSCLPVLCIVIFTLACAQPTTDLASESIKNEVVFCAPFDGDGFEGTLSVKLSKHSKSYETDSALLNFDRMPEAFRYQVGTYIQLFGLSYTEDGQPGEPQRLDIELINLRNENYSKLLTFIDVEHIRNEDFDVDNFFKDHGFKILDTAGVQTLIIALFNDEDAKILNTQVLIPPFPSNPHTYQDEVSEDLVKYHPFFNTLETTDSDDEDLFLSKAEQACRRA